ncbi:MAG: hypothetical protein IKQ64_00220 [Bacteroidales bacterium]|nr:hypothetical protein [Bacteroidales bacterium]
MKTQHLMLKALCALAATAAVSMGCSGLEPYVVDAPADLADKIAEYQAEKQASQSDDYTEITITTAIAGAEDNSSAWWTEFSQYFKVPTGKKLVVEFENFGSGANNWNNWNVCVATPYERATDGYQEYFVIRSDAYGWGNADYNGAMIEFDYGGGEVNWDEFREKMQGANVTLSLDHARAGFAFLEVKNVAKDGFVITEKYNQPVSSTEDIEAFLICDGSHFNIKKAYLVPSEIAEIPDEMAESISVSGLPAAVELGSPAEDILAEAVATVTFTDNSNAVVPLEDVTFSLTDDFTATVGKKTLVYSYSKTKQGNYGKSVAGYTEIEVTNPVVGIVPHATAYIIGGAKYVTLSPEAVQVECIYGDGSKGMLKSGQFTLSFTDDKYVYEGVEGTYENAFTATYTTSSGEAITESGTLTIAKSSLEPQTEQVGATDFTNGWWSTFSRDWTVAPGTSQTVSMYVGSDNLGNWHSPCTILRKADMSEYCVVRMDHYGWGGSYDASSAKSSNWDWDTFMGNINGSQVSITVANSGDGFASIRYRVISADGTEHFQWYDSLPVDSDDVQFALVTEESYLIFD